MFEVDELRSSWAGRQAGAQLHPRRESHANNVLSAACINWFRNELIACAAQNVNILPNYYNNNSLQEVEDCLTGKSIWTRPAACSHKHEAPHVAYLFAQLEATVELKLCKRNCWTKIVQFENLRIEIDFTNLLYYKLLSIRLNPIILHKLKSHLVCDPGWSSKNWVNYFFVWHLVVSLVWQRSLLFGLIQVKFSLCRKKIFINTSEIVAPRIFVARIIYLHVVYAVLCCFYELYELFVRAITQVVCFIFVFQLRVVSCSSSLSCRA